MLAVADRHALVPALWSSLLSRRLVDLPPASLRRFVIERGPQASGGLLAAEEAHAANGRRVDDLMDQALVALRALTAAGLRAAPLKGIDAVLTGRYPDPAARTMTDIDLLVDEGGAPAAAAVLADLGYRPAPGTAASSHQLPAVSLPGRAGSIELHTQLATARWAGVLEPVRVLDRTLAAGDGTGVRLDRTDSAAHLVVHAQLHDEAHLLMRLPLRAVHETALILAAGEAVDWDEIHDEFAAAGRRSALHGHLQLAAMIFGAVPPIEIPRRSRARAGTVIALDERPGLGQLVAEAAYLPRALAPERMSQLHGAAGRPSLLRARAAHVARGAMTRAVRRWKSARAGERPGDASAEPGSSAAASR